MTKVMRKEARHTQRRDRASGVPLEILEHLPPKPESAYFLLCALTGREAALAWASLAQRFPASSVLAREGAGCGAKGDGIDH